MYQNHHQRRAGVGEEAEAGGVEDDKCCEYFRKRTAVWQRVELNGSVMGFNPLRGTSRVWPRSLSFYFLEHIIC